MDWSVLQSGLKRKRQHTTRERKRGEKEKRKKRRSTQMNHGDKRLESRGGGHLGAWLPRSKKEKKRVKGVTKPLRKFHVQPTGTGWIVQNGGIAERIGEPGKTQMVHETSKTKVKGSEPWGK